MKGMQKIKRGTGFRGVLNYVMEDGRGQIIGGNLGGTTSRELAREFGAVRQLRPDIKKPVWHNSLRLPASEHIDSDRFVAIADDYMDRMGFSDKHPRVYMMHDDPAGQHVHIIASRVAIDGSVYLGQNENLISTRYIAALELEHGLQVTKGLQYDQETSVVMLDRAKITKGEIEMALKTGEEPPRQLIARVIDAAFSSGHVSAVAFMERLESAGIHAVPSMAKSTDKLNGFSFAYGGVQFKGSDIGKSYGLAGLMGKGLIYEQATHGAELRRLGATAADRAERDRVAAADRADATTRADATSAQRDAAEHQADARPDAGRVSGEGRAISAEHGELVRRATSADQRMEESEDRRSVGLEKCSGRAVSGSVGRESGGESSRSSSGRDHHASDARDAQDAGARRIGVGVVFGSHDRILDLSAPASVSASDSSGRESGSRPHQTAPDAVAKLAAWRQQHAALGAPHYRVTLKDRVQHGGRDRTYNPGKRTDGEQFWTPDEVENLIPRLRRENARGFDVYITPIDARYHYMVIDDSTPAKLAEMRRDGYCHALVQQSSANNVQAVIKAPRDAERKDEQNLANKLVMMLNQSCGDPKFSGVIHPFRMAGFSNKKPDKKGAFTRILEAAGAICEKSGAMLADMRNRADIEAQRAAETRWQEQQQAKVREIEQHGGDESDAATAYKKHAKKIYGLAKRNGWPIDWSRIDYAATQAMLIDGWRKSAVESAILAASPGVYERHSAADDYAQRTVEKAHQSDKVQKHIEAQISNDMSL